VLVKCQSVSEVVLQNKTVFTATSFLMGLHSVRNYDDVRYDLAGDSLTRRVGNGCVCERDGHEKHGEGACDSCCAELWSLGHACAEECIALVLVIKRGGLGVLCLASREFRERRRRETALCELVVVQAADRMQHSSIAFLMRRGSRDCAVWGQVGEDWHAARHGSRSRDRR
jgi:hypothetical protein